MKDRLKKLYESVILGHSRNPYHSGRPDVYTHSAEARNPLCGDEVRFFLNISDDRLHEVAFEGQGCALSLASASLLCRRVEGMESGELMAFLTRFEDWILGDGKMPLTDATDELAALGGVKGFPARLKCVMLPVGAIRNALSMVPGSE